MKSRSKCRKCSVIITIIGLLISLVVFMMQIFGTINVNSNGVFYIITVTIGDFTILGLLGLSIYSSNKAGRQSAFCKCGSIAVIGAIGTMAAPLFTSIINQADYLILYRLGVSSCFFFLTLLLGELWCTYYSYNRCTCGKTTSAQCENPQSTQDS